MCINIGALSVYTSKMRYSNKVILGEIYIIVNDELSQACAHGCIPTAAHFSLLNKFLYISHIMCINIEALNM